MSLRSKHLTLVGAAGAVALTIGSLASPAFAATKNLTYSCATLGPTATTFDFGTLKSKMVAGETDKHAMSQVVHLSSDQGALAKSLGDDARGKLTAKGAKNTLPFSMKLPSTPITGNAQDIHVAGTGTIRPLAAGTWKVNLGSMKAALILTKGGVDTPVTDSCAAPSGAAKTLGTITVSKDKSKTATTAKYSGKKDVAKGTAKVKGAKFGLAGTGKVKFTLKKGTHAIKTMTGKLNKRGVASVNFKNVKKKGKYSITAKFGGDKALKASSGKDTFKV